MVGIPGTEERLILADVEDRLRQVRGRFNFHMIQHHLYRLGTALALGTALLIVFTFLLSPLLFTLVSWPILVLLAFCFLFLLRKGVANWADLNEIARRVDAKVGLKERLATLVSHLTSGVIGKPSPSPLWPHLLAENSALLNEWEVRKVAPSRIPRSIVPFLLALLLAFFIASVPLLSDRSTPDPFSLNNLQIVLSEFPDRASELLEKQISLLPESQGQWGGSTLYDAPANFEGKNLGTTDAGKQNQNTPGDTRNLDLRSLASLPEALQEKIRQALKGLPNRGQPPKPQEEQPADQDRRLALQPSKDKKKPTSSMEAENLPPGEKFLGASRNRGDKRKEQALGQGNSSVATPAPTQGAGLQQLEHAQLDRKNVRGTFQPDSPQVPGSGGEAGEGGPGAGSGTDPRIYGEQKDLRGGSHTFQIALETTHEKSTEGESETDDKDTGGIIEKSSKNLSRQQSLDDAIRKSQIPAEYEEIVKRLFARGESR